MTGEVAPGVLATVLRHPDRLRPVGDGCWRVGPAGTEGSPDNPPVDSPMHQRLAWDAWPPLWPRMFRHVLASDAPRKPILDSGCGSLAVTAAAYRSFGAESLVLLDRSLVALGAARRRRPQGVFLQGDPLALPFSDGAFGAAVSWGDLHRFGAASSLLPELERVVAPGRSVCLSTLVLTGCASSDRTLHRLHAHGEGAEPVTAEVVRAAFQDRFTVEWVGRNGGPLLVLGGRRRALSVRDRPG